MARSLFIISSGFLLLIFSCTDQKRDQLVGKKWIGLDTAAFGHDSLGVQQFTSIVVEYLPDSNGIMHLRLPDFKRTDTALVSTTEKFTYYRKGRTLYVKSATDSEFREQNIKELTDSTLHLAFPELKGIVFRYKAMKEKE